MKNRAKIEVKGTTLSISYGQNSLTITGSELDRLKDDYTTLEEFLTRAEDMCIDYLQMDGYDWDYDEKELQRKLSVIFENFKKK